ncbi:MAG: energy-coupling factor transporter ATPase [Armatimonadota bacterium]
MIKASNLNYKYKLASGEEINALSGINLNINMGEFIAIIGHNGSGKSTLVKHFNALLLPSEGEVFIEGINTKDKDRIWDLRRNVGMIFQNPDNQIVGTIVEEDVAFGPENLQVPSDQILKRVDESLRLVGMEKYRKSPPHLLSGGQKQKVAIASVLAMHSNYIILDEATTMLDPKGRREVMYKIRQLNREEGLTIILVTHFMEEASSADRVIVMNKGTLFMDGTPQEVFSNEEKLKEVSLDLPTGAKLACSLRKKGINLSENVLTIDDFADEYKKLLMLRKAQKVGR